MGAATTSKLRANWACIEKQCNSGAIEGSAEVPRLTAAELSGVSDFELQSMMAEVLMDEPRDGVPVKFTAEQVTQIIAIACEHPQPSERPISQWSAEEIAQEAIQRGIVETISAQQ